MSCGVDCRCFSDPALLRLWPRLATEPPIQPLALELPYAADSVKKKIINGKVVKKSDSLL